MSYKSNLTYKEYAEITCPDCNREMPETNKRINNMVDKIQDLEMALSAAKQDVKMWRSKHRRIAETLDEAQAENRKLRGEEPIVTIEVPDNNEEEDPWR